MSELGLPSKSKWVEIRKLELCGHSPVDWDMFKFVGFALVWVGPMVGVKRSKNNVMIHKSLCWVDREGNFICDLADIWTERMNVENVVSHGMACELCLNGIQKAFGKEFALFTYEPVKVRGEAYPKPVRCDGSIGVQDLRKNGNRKR